MADVPESSKSKVLAPRLEPDTSLDRPTFLSPVQGKPEGMEMVRGEHIVLPRACIVQSKSKVFENDSEKYKVGMLYCSVSGDILCDVTEEMVFTPLFFYPEWLHWDKQGGKGLLERTVDPTSRLAQESKRLLGEKAQDETKYVEYLNFVVAVPKLGADAIYVISCSSTSYKHGKRLITMMAQRQAPAYSMRFGAMTDKETNRAGQTYRVWKFANRGWVSNEVLMNMYADQYRRIKNAYEERLISVAQDEGEVDGGAVDVGAVPVDSPQAAKAEF